MKLEKNKSALTHMNLNEISKQIHQNAINHGWWPTHDKKEIPEKLCLIHQEISEALGEYRNGNTGDEFITELADVIIRILDLCGAYDFDIVNSIVEKHLKNIDRDYRHGNKLC